MVYSKDRSESLKKHNWKMASFIEIINMSEKELKNVHPYSFQQLQPRTQKTISAYRNEISQSLAYVLPEKLILNLNEYQLSTFGNHVLASFSEETIEELYHKFKDTIVDYQDYMLYAHQGLDLGKRLLEVQKIQNTRKIQSTKHYEKGLAFFEKSGMISLNSIAQLIKITDYTHPRSITRYLKELKVILQDKEIIPKNKALYEELKEKSKSVLYNYSEIKKWIFKGYQGKKNEDNLRELCKFKDVLKYFVKEGYLITANQKLNEETFNYLRYGQFPFIHISLQTNEYKLYFLSEIEEYVQNFQKTGIIPLETPLNKERINKIEK